ncbi:MAG: P1 family peptidase, partial [Bacteroidetes bacterium]|nr:P1 family peptidase [Bacteroidota bacterium]
MHFNSIKTRRSVGRSLLQSFLLFAIALPCSAADSIRVSNNADQRQTKPRARELGVAPGVLNPGPLNAITDVSGVLVSHVTLIEGTDVRTGVTAILPHGGNLYQEKVPAG